MEDDFKVPTFEPKLKVVTKKSKPSADNVDELKEETTPIEIPPVTVVKEPESAKCETNSEQKIPKLSICGTKMVSSTGFKFSVQL